MKLARAVINGLLCVRLVRVELHWSGSHLAPAGGTGSASITDVDVQQTYGSIDKSDAARNPLPSSRPPLIHSPFFFGSLFIIGFIYSSFKYRSAVVRRINQTTSK